MMVDKSSEAWELATRMAKGEYLVSRLINQKHMTYEVAGEEVLFGDDLKGEVEKILGVGLEEYADPRYGNEIGVRVPEEWLERVQRRVASMSVGLGLDLVELGGGACGGSAGKEWPLVVARGA